MHGKAGWPAHVPKAMTLLMAMQSAVTPEMPYVQSNLVTRASFRLPHQVGSRKASYCEVSFVEPSSNVLPFGRLTRMHKKIVHWRIISNQVNYGNPSLVNNFQLEGLRFGTA